MSIALDEVEVIRLQIEGSTRRRAIGLFQAVDQWWPAVGRDWVKEVVASLREKDFWHES